MSTYTKDQLAPTNLGSAVVSTPYLSAEAVVKAVNEKIDRAGDSNIGTLQLSGSIEIGNATVYSKNGANTLALNESVVGCKGYVIADNPTLVWTVNDEKTEVTVSADFDFDSRIAVGEQYAMNNASDSPAWCGKVTYVAGNVMKLDGQACNYAKASIHEIFFPEHPDYGRDVVTGTLGTSLGYGCYAMGPCSYSEGYNNKSAGKYAHTEGNNTKAGWGSHAEGADNAATGNYSHVAGRFVSSDQNLTYAWAGDSAKHVLSSADRANTFNVWPKGGINGFYIGDKNLSSIIREVVDGRMPADPTARIVPCGQDMLLSSAEQFVDANIDKTKSAPGGEPVQKTIDEIKAEADHLYAYIDKGDGTYEYRGVTTTQHKDVEPWYNTYEWRELTEKQTTSYIKKEGDTDIGPLTLSGALTLASGAEFTLLCSNIRQTTTPDTVYNLSYKNSFLQAEEAFSGEGKSYGIACTGAKGYCILSVCPEINALKLSGELSALEENMVCAYSYAAYSTAKSEFSTISAVDRATGLIYFNKPFESALASLSSKTEEENIQTFFDDDNALYCPRNPLIGNQIIGNFYANHAEGGSVKAVGKYTHAEGRATVADVRYSHAEGSFSFAGGIYSHAEGNSTVAHGDCGHAEGNSTYAEGNHSHAEGNDSKAYGTCSHAAGDGAVVSANNSWAWSGNGAYTVSADRDGSFNVNPKGGLSNFYVCNKSVQTTFNELVNSKVYVCENQAEVDECKTELSPTFEQIYNNWLKFGHFNGTQYGLDDPYIGGTPPSDVRSGVSSWYYSSAISTICQPTNTTDFTGYVSNKKYDNYEFIIRAYSAGTDDGYNGIVAAFATDANGRQHTFSFLRTPNSRNGEESKMHHWFCVIDANAPFYPKQTGYGQKLVVNCPDLNIETEASDGWNTKGVGALVSVVRSGNKFIAKTTKFEASKASVDKSELGYELVVDLDALIADPAFASYKEVLKLFCKPCPIGYCTYSQGDSKYQNVEFPDDEYVLVNMQTSKVEKFNKSTRKWDVWQVDPRVAVGNGRFAYNDVTKKQFFNNGSLIFNVSSTSDGKITPFSKTDTANISDTEGMIAAVKQILMKLGMPEQNITVE